MSYANSPKKNDSSRLIVPVKSMQLLIELGY